MSQYEQNPGDAAREGRLLARPSQDITPGQPGMHRLPSDHGRGGVLCVPSGFRAEYPLPLVVMLHGAGGSVQRTETLETLAEEQSTIMLAPESRGRTWDVIVRDFGPDVAYIDNALRYAFAHYAIDPARLAIGGFSDGASYALTLGLANGDLFSHVLAFSPGFVAPAEERGRPQIFVSHGTNDRVLPIDRCSRRIVPRLRQAGYDVRYDEFDGPHTVPPHIIREAIGWFRAAGGSAERVAQG